MLINEFTFYELKTILEPVIQLQPMTTVVSEIGKIVKISKPTRDKIQKQTEFHLRYKGFDVLFSDLRWLRNQGPCISVQFRRPATKFQSFFNKLFPKNHTLMNKVCGELIDDLKKICISKTEGIKFATTEVNGYDSLGRISEDVPFRVIYPSGAFNHKWNEGREISPLMITSEFHSDKWFISFSFNAGCFTRNDNNQTVLRTDWEKYIAEVSKSIKEWVERNYHPDDSRKKTFDEWSADMILDFGDEIIPSLPEIWIEVTK